MFLYFRPTEETGVYSLDNIGLVQNAEMGQWEGMSQRKNGSMEMDSEKWFTKLCHHIDDGQGFLQK